MSLKKIASRNVATVSADATVRDAARVMREQHVGDVVVIEARAGRDAPVGILTDRDIVLSTVALGVAPDQVSVRDVMAPALLSAKTTDSFYHVLNIMKEHGVKRVPLVNDAGTLEGIVSSDDIVAMLASELGDIVRVRERQHQVEGERRRKLG